MNSEAGPKGEGQDARSKREVTKRKDPSLPRFAGIVPAKSAVGLRSLSTTHRATAPCVASTPASMPSPVLTPNWPASVPATLRACPPPGLRFRGARVERRASCAYFSEEPEQQPERRFASALHRVRATMTRCSTRGPCAAVRCGRQARRGIGTMPIPFRQHRDVLSKSPAPAHGLAGQARAWMPELRQRRSSCPSPASAQAGCSFSLSTQRESDSGAGGARKLFAL
jgi:hypothetical protein